MTPGFTAKVHKIRFRLGHGKRRDGGVEGRVEGWGWTVEVRGWGRERTSCDGDFFRPLLPSANYLLLQNPEQNNK